MQPNEVTDFDCLAILGIDARLVSPQGETGASGVSSGSADIPVTGSEASEGQSSREELPITEEISGEESVLDDEGDDAMQELLRKPSEARNKGKEKSQEQRGGEGWESGSMYPPPKGAKVESHRSGRGRSGSALDSIAKLDATTSDSEERISRSSHLKDASAQTLDQPETETSTDHLAAISILLLQVLPVISIWSLLQLVPTPQTPEKQVARMIKLLDHHSIKISAKTRFHPNLLISRKKEKFSLIQVAGIDGGEQAEVALWCGRHLDEVVMAWRKHRIDLFEDVLSRWTFLLFNISSIIVPWIGCVGFGWKVACPVITATFLLTLGGSFVYLGDWKLNRRELFLLFLIEGLLFAAAL